MGMIGRLHMPIYSKEEVVLIALTVFLKHRKIIIPSHKVVDFNGLASYLEIPQVKAFGDAQRVTVGKRDTAISIQGKAALIVLTW